MKENGLREIQDSLFLILLIVQIRPRSGPTVEHRFVQLAVILVRERLLGHDLIDLGELFGGFIRRDVERKGNIEGLSILSGKHTVAKARKSGQKEPEETQV